MNSVGNLIPDSITQQNIWAVGPSNSGLFGIGLSGSFTFFDKKSLGNIVNSTNEFTGKDADLESFPTSIPFLPAASLDLRWGPKVRNSPVAFDFGLSGLWYDVSSLGILPEGNTFTYWTAGADMRVSILQDGMFGEFVPAVFFQGGYFFTALKMGFESQWDADYDGGMRHFDEYVKMDFKTQTFFAALQISKKVGNFGRGHGRVIPYVGYKAIISDKNTDFEWGTSRSVSFRDEAYPMGMDYESGGIDGGYKFYHEIYGGMAISFFTPQLLTVGFAYNFATEHFGVNASVKLANIGFYTPSGAREPREPSAKVEREPRRTQAQREAEELDRREAEQAAREADLAQAAENERRRQAAAERAAELAQKESERRQQEKEAAAERKAARIAGYELVNYPAGIDYGNWLINTGLGVGVPFRGKIGVPPLMVSVDYAQPIFKLPFTLGAMAAYSADKSGDLVNNLSLAFRIAYHADWIPLWEDELDVYAAGVLGFAVRFGEDGGPPAAVVPGVVIGARYFFLDFLGVYAELGYTPLYIFSVGAVFRVH
jgi:hypothetical protein